MNGRLHCGAGDFLSITPMLVHAAETRLSDGPLQLESLSLQHAYAVVKLIQELKSGNRAFMEERILELREAMQAHFASRARAYGPLAYVPKHHYNWHTPMQISRDQGVCDMFLLERHHKVLKHLASDITNTNTYEKSLMSSATAAHLHSLQAPVGTLFGGLSGEIKPLPGHPGISVAVKLVSENGLHLAVDDFVQKGRNGDVGMVGACLLQGGALFVEVTVFEKLTETPCHAKCKANGIHETWPVELCLSFSAWYRDGDVTVVCK